MIGKNVEIQTQWNHFDLSAPADAKGGTNLHALLLADNYQTVGDEFGQQPFDRKEHSRSIAPIVTMKHMTVIRMYKLALTWLAHERSRRQPTIEKTGQTSDRPGFGRVSMNDVRPLANKNTKEFPDCDCVVQRYLAAHL